MKTIKEPKEFLRKPKESKGGIMYKKKCLGRLKSPKIPWRKKERSSKELNNLRDS